MKNIYRIIGTDFRSNFFYLIILMVIASILEMFGISLIIPVMLSLSSQNIFSEYPFLEKINIMLNLPTNNELILISVSIFGLVYIFKNLYMVLFYYLESNFLANLLEKISNDLFSTYIHQPYEFYTNVNKSELITRFRSDLPAFRSSILAFSNIFIEIFILTGITFFLAIYNFEVFIIVFLLVTSFSIAFSLFFKKKFKSLGIEKQIVETSRSKSLQESFDAIREIKISKLELIFINAYNLISTRLKFNFAGTSFLRSLPRVFFEILAITILVSIIYFIFFMTNFEISNVLPVLGVFTGAALKVLPSANRLISSFNSIKYNNKSIEMIIKDLEKPNNFEYRNLDKLRKFELKNISFKYDNKHIFDNVNITINHNEKIFIYGETGCGKSTLLDLILGLKKPNEGQIFINGKEISNINYSFNKILGYVPQNVFLFDDTLKNNITLFKEVDDKNLFNQCLKISRLEKLINSLSLKENSLVGQNGVKISGGQKQRVGISRELYKNPDIYVFDESTNSLDEKTEQEFFENFLDFATNKTIIFVSHNQKLKQYFDKVYKIENQKIYEE